MVSAEGLVCLDEGSLPVDGAAILGALAEGVLVRGLDGRVLAANRAAERLLGVTLAEYRKDPGCFRWRLFDESGGELGHAELPSALAAVSGRAQRRVLGFVAPDGTERRWLGVDAVPLRDRTGLPVAVAVTFADVTDCLEAGLRDRIAVELLALLARSAALEEYLSGTIRLARSWTGFAAVGLRAVVPHVDRAVEDRGALPAGAGVVEIPLACCGDERGAFLVDPADAAGSPWSIALLRHAAPLVGQALFRFGVEEMLRLAHESERALGELRAVSLATRTLPALLDGAARVLRRLSFGPPSAGLGVRLGGPDGALAPAVRAAGDGTEGLVCAHCGGDRIPCRPEPSGAPGPCGRRALRLPLRSADGEVHGLLAACGPPGPRLGTREERFLEDVAGILGTALQRWRLDETLRASEARHRRIVETVHDGMWTFDPDARVTFASRQMGELLGVPAADLVGQPLSRFVLPEELDEVRDQFRRVLRGERVRAEVRLLRADGSTSWCLVSASPVLDGAGQLQGVLAMMSDVTERRRAEDQLRQAQKMEALGRLAGGVAHDFNNVLAVILSTAELLQREVGPGSDLAPDLEEIVGAGRRAAGLTRQLLAFSRKNPGRPEPTDPAAVVAGVEQLLRRTIGADVELRIRSDVPGWSVRIDPTQLEQVVMNLALNARDAMPRGGRLDVTTSACEVTSAGAPVAPGRWVRLTVRDTGEGIPADLLPRIFEPFFTTKERGRGTGLGLSTVHGIVESAGGRIEVASASGAGATFTVWLPASEEVAPRAAPPVRPAVPSGGGETVLLVEDEEALRGIVRRCLDRAGYRVVEASDGEEALARIGSGAAIDLVVSDVVMPRLSGLELLDRLGGARPPVVLMSGYPGDRATVPTGVSDLRFVEKPFREEALLGAIAALLGKLPAESAA